MQCAETEAVSDQGPEEKLPLIESRPSVKRVRQLRDKETSELMKSTETKRTER